MQKDAVHTSHKTTHIATWEVAPSAAYGGTSPANAGEDKNRTYAPLFTGELSRFIVTEGATIQLSPPQTLPL